MHKILLSILFFVAFSFASNIQVITPTGADFSPNAPDMVLSIVRSAVSQAGFTPTEQSSSVQLTTSLMTMGSSIIVLCEKKEDNVIIGSGKQKAASIDELDVAIEQAVFAAVSNKSTASSASVSEPSSQVENNQTNTSYTEKAPVRRYSSFGFGLSYWYNWKSKDSNPTRDSDIAYALRYARIWENSSTTAIILQNNMIFKFYSEGHFQESATIGGRFFHGGSIAPYIGAGLGFGFQIDTHFDDTDGNAFGLVGDANAGVIFFQKSSVQMELGVRYNILFDGLSSFSHNFGATTFFIAVNY